MSIRKFVILIIIASFIAYIVLSFLYYDESYHYKSDVQAIKRLYPNSYIEKTLLIGSFRRFDAIDSLTGKHYLIVMYRDSSIYFTKQVKP